MATKVTYNRKHPGDPDTVDWNGMTFKHGEAVELDGRKNEHKTFIESARGNPWFEVDGETTEGGRVPTRADVESAEEGKGAETYRAYAIDWITKLELTPVDDRGRFKGPKASDKLEKRWAAEDDLRKSVGWGTDDQVMIDPVYQPKLEKLREAEKA